MSFACLVNIAFMLRIQLHPRQFDKYSLQVRHGFERIVPLAYFGGDAVLYDFSLVQKRDMVAQADSFVHVVRSQEYRRAVVA
jgi:hypothetical protein